ncbi:hypothetical protein GCM10028857_05130 [Salinarchaeum chitinilyticum]
MTESDEHLLTAAKIAEIAAGNIDSDLSLRGHAANVVDDDHSRSLSFMERAMGEPVDSTDWGAEVVASLQTDGANAALRDGRSDLLSGLVGITEQDLDASSLRLPVQLLAELENDGAPAFLTIAGNPNTGKTNLGFMAGELREAQLDEYLIISNVSTSTSTDIVVTSAYDLLVALLEHRETPKAVILDEGSTHLDASVYGYAVRTQLTPMAKRFAKLGVDVFAAIGHTGKDIDPECKRLTTLAAFKSERTTAEFYEKWPADSDAPTGRMFGGPVEEIEPAVDEYAPDDAAPWAWNLPEGIFSRDLDWPELLEWLRDAGPAES